MFWLDVYLTNDEVDVIDRLVGARGREMTGNDKVLMPEYTEIRYEIDDLQDAIDGAKHVFDYAHGVSITNVARYERSVGV